MALSGSLDGTELAAAPRTSERDAKPTTYTKNAQFIWGLTPGDGWALYNVRQDPACQTNLVPAKKDIADRLHQAYGRWWDSIYPDMFAAGGDASLTEARVERTRSKRKGPS